MFVDPTPGDKLLKMLRHTESMHMISSDMRIKFVSKCGTKLIQKFQKRDPFQEACKTDNCRPCDPLEQGSKVFSNCRSNNISYEAQCLKCKSEGKTKVYIGETSRNLYMRSCEHYNDLKNKNERSFMLKHIQKEHVNKQHEVKFKWRVLQRFKKPLQRQLFEAQQIKMKARNVILNSKNEFNQNNTNGLNIQNRNYQCNKCSAKFDKFQSLSEHKESFHNRIKCTKCDYTTFSSVDLKYHMRYKHDEGHSSSLAVSVEPQPIN